MTTRGEDGVYLHIGVPKTGTTYLQNFLWANREELRERGLLLAAERQGDHYAAVIDLQGGRFAGHEVAGVEGAWQRVAALAERWPGRSLISHEIFGGLQEAKIEEVFETLGSRPVHVVLTLRDLARIVPAVWQESAKNQRVDPWPDFLERVSKLHKGRDRRFWRLQNVSRILSKWGQFVPAERVHVVTLPPPGAARTLLIERYCAAFGVDARGLNLDITVANESIGAAEVALLQRINSTASERMSWEDYHDYLKHFAVPRLLATRVDSTRITMPDSALPWLREETERTRATITEMGCDLIGDLDDLSPRTAGDDYVDPSTVTEEEVLQAAVDLSVGMVEEYAALARETKAATMAREAFIGVRRGKLGEVRDLVQRARAAARSGPAAQAQSSRRRGR